MGLLGDKIINISLGTLAAKQHQNGDLIKSIAPLDLNKAVTKGQQVLDNLVASSDELKGALQDFTSKGGDVAMAEAILLDSNRLVFENFQHMSLRNGFSPRVRPDAIPAPICIIGAS